MGRYDDLRQMREAPLGDKPMTPAERMRRYRARKQQETKK